MDERRVAAVVGSLRADSSKEGDGFGQISTTPIAIASLSRD